MDAPRTKDMIPKTLIEMILEAIEEVGLANAIHESRQDDFVEEEVIF